MDYSWEWGPTPHTLSAQYLRTRKIQAPAPAQSSLWRMSAAWDSPISWRPTKIRRASSLGRWTPTTELMLSFWMAQTTTSPMRTDQLEAHHGRTRVISFQHATR